MDIKYLIKDWFRSKSIQEFINNRYKDPSKIILPKNGVFKVIGTGTELFYLDDMYITIEQAANDYDYNDLRPTDIVLDIGACIGGFCLPISRKVKKIYAIEPIMNNILLENISLNCISNIIVHPYALGEGILDLNWCGYKASKYGLSLKEIISACGGHIDFLKCDCEGGEWSITPEDLIGIRRIEIEVHNFDGRHSYLGFLYTLYLAGFSYTYNILNDQITLIHAKSLVIK